MIYFLESNSYLIYIVSGIILIPGILFAGYCSAKVMSTFNKYNKVNASSRITASRMAREILNRAGLTHINIIKVSGTLTDYYDHKNQTLALSEAVYNSTSVGALGVSAHECGHAIQYAKNYAPVKIRSGLVPIINITSKFLWPVVIVGIGMGFTDMDTWVGMLVLMAGVVFFGMTVLFSLITLPTELDASRRANKILVEIGALTAEESKGAKKVLNAAAMTYVAALVNAILNLLRILLVFLLSRRRR